ncbi:hypothetical protein AHF37_02107 [Paragonimus kellicotti]|nr:hypothetical protein AHF37_02107 [Paragonimus kellicotti]
MFMYARYPNSSILKSHFPDVAFTRATTAQLVKWFSNFREFFYIQVEKFARQYLTQQEDIERGGNHSQSRIGSHLRAAL